MFFSVVIPLFNRESVIKSTIESVLNQTFSDFELIVVDDGSTDNSLEVVRAISDNRIKIVQKQNEGVSSARNAGISAASTDYIAFLDSDDIWHRDFLKEMHILIGLYQDCGIFCSATTLRFSSGLNIELSRVERNSGVKYMRISDYFISSLYGPYMNASAVVIRKSVFNEIGEFVFGARVGEDLEMWARIMLKYSMAYCTTSLSYYNMGASNQATQVVKLEEKYVLYESFYNLFMLSAVPIEKSTDVMRYIKYKFYEDADILIFSNLEHKLSEFCKICHADFFAPDYLKIANSNLRKKIRKFLIYMRKIVHKLRREICLIVFKRFSTSKGKRLAVFSRNN